MRLINRIKVMLVEQNHTGKWLAQTIGKNNAIVSRWCSNAAQPLLKMLVYTAQVLNVDVRELLNTTK